MASSGDAATKIAWTNFTDGSTRCNMPITRLVVAPVQLRWRRMVSVPPKIGTAAASCSGDGRSKPAARMPRNSPAFSPMSSNVSSISGSVGTTSASPSSTLMSAAAPLPLHIVAADASLRSRVAGLSPSGSKPSAPVSACILLCVPRGVPQQGSRRAECCAVNWRRATLGQAKF